MKTLTLKRPLRPSLVAKLKAPSRPPVQAPPGKPDPAVAKRAGAWLVTAFPDLFKDPPVPLPIGFRLMAAKQRPEGVSLNGLQRALHRWTNSKGYLQALAAEGSMRHDLNGNPVEPVTDKHRAVAAMQLRRRLGRNVQEGLANAA
jgi:sRNA-binding protein